MQLYAIKPCFHVYNYAISEITVPVMPLLCPGIDPLLSAVLNKVMNTTFLQPKSSCNTTLLLHDTGDIFTLYFNIIFRPGGGCIQLTRQLKNPISI